MKKYVLTCFCLGLLMNPILAQQQDSIAKAREEADALDAAMRKRSEEDSAYQIKFNALRYSMQKRYRPNGAKFVNDSFFDNFFIGLWGGYNRIVPRAGVDLTGGGELGMSVSKFFTPSVGVRLSGSWSSAKRQSDNEPWSSYSVTADHLFNLSSAVAGYDPNRMLEVSTVGGLGYHISSLAGQRKAAADFHLGMQLKLNTGTRLDLFFEPRLTLYTDGIDLSNEQNWHKYDAGLSAVVGFNYRLGTYYKYGSTEASEESFMENTFISAGMGMQFHNSELVRQQGILGSMGPAYHVAVGKWFLDSFGLRMSAFGSYNSWKRAELGDIDYMTLYAGGRAEVMINPLAFFRKDVHDMRWGIIPMVGVEMGMMKKQDTKGAITKGYAGWTGGLQLKYYASDNFAFYIEPRMSKVPYSFSEKTTSGRVNEYSFYDHLFNASIGIELRRPTRPEWRQLAAFREDFVPYYYTQFGVGLTSAQQLYRSSSRRPGYMLNAAIGRQLSPLSGVRFGLEINNSNTYDLKGAIDRYAFTSFSLNYMFDISNLVIGYHPERKFGAEAFAGPVISKNFDPGKTYIGGEGGVRAYWNLLDQFDIYAEPKVRMYLDRYMPAIRGEGTPFQFSMAVGTSYRFGTSYRKSLASGFGDGTLLGNTFVSVGAGVQTLAKSGGNLDPLAAAGPQLNLSVGKWLLPFWGIRASVFGGYSSWGRVTVKNGLQADRLNSYIGGRVEGMLNVLAIGSDGLSKQRWALVPMLGLEFGKMMKQSSNVEASSTKKSYTGITAALQAKYRINDNIGVFIEPRLSRIPYSITSGTPAKRSSSADNVLSFNVGLEFSRSSKKELKSMASFKDDFVPYYFASAHLGTSMPMQKTRYASRKLGFFGGGAVGRQFLPCSGLRAGLDYSLLPGSGGNTESSSFVNLSLDYMFDISNYLGGYNPDRLFGMEVLAGPVLSLGSEPNKMTIGGEAGLRAYYKLEKGFDVYVEPKIRLYSKSLVLGSNTSPAQMMFSVGTSYKF